MTKRELEQKVLELETKMNAFEIDMENFKNTILDATSE